MTNVIAVLHFDEQHAKPGIVMPPLPTISTEAIQLLKELGWTPPADKPEHETTVAKLARDLIHDAILDVLSERMVLAEKAEDHLDGLDDDAQEAFLDDLENAIREHGRDFLSDDE